MIKKEIPHSLRTISLHYDEEKQETAYENKLLNDYVLLHSIVEETKQECDRVIYFYKEHDAEITTTEKEFKPLFEFVNSFQQQLNQFYAAKEKTIDEAWRLQEVSNNCYETIQDFQVHIYSLDASSKEIEQQYEKYSVLADKMYSEVDKHRFETSNDLYKNYNEYSLSMVDYDDDSQQLFKYVDEIYQKMYNNREPIIDHYNELMKKANDAYRLYEELTKQLVAFFDDKHLLDSSLSDNFAVNKDNKKDFPVYLTKPGNQIISRYRNTLGIWANSNQKSFSFNVTIDLIKKSNVATIQEFIIALQHYPKLIEKTVFAIDIHIQDEFGITLEPDKWKGVAEPMRWFAKMSSLPCIIFFLADHDARAYALMGDLVADKKLETGSKGKHQMVKMEGEMLNLITNRLFHYCWFFMLYCHNTGFNPEAYVEAIIADFNLPFKYEDVLKRYKEDVENGIELRSETIENNK